jgi:cyclic pyranopterin phosphate synthase
VRVTGAEVGIEPDAEGGRLRIVVTVRAIDRTGVEMEALTSVCITALTIIDMVKAVDPAAVITDVRVDSKTGGTSGEWTRP